MKGHTRPVLLAALAAVLGLASGICWFMFGCELDDMLADF